MASNQRNSSFVRRLSALIIFGAWFTCGQANAQARFANGCDPTLPNCGQTKDPGQLLVMYTAGEGEAATRLAAGEPFHVSLDTKAETVVVFSLQLLDQKNNPISPVTWHVKLSGPLSQYAQVESDAGRSATRDLQFESGSPEPAQVKWVFPPLTDQNFLSSLSSSSPSADGDLSLEVQASPKQRQDQAQ